MLKVAIAQILYKPCYVSGTTDYLIEPFGDNSTSISNLSFPKDKKFCQRYREKYISWLRAKIINIVKYCSEGHVDILVFPEYSIPVELLAEIENELKQSELIVVAGTHLVTSKNIQLPHNYPKQKDIINHAICPVIASNGMLGYTAKTVQSQWEVGLKTELSADVPIIVSPKCNLAIEICIEALMVSKSLQTHDNTVCIIPSYSPTTIPFYNNAVLNRYNEVPTLYANSANLGGSSIYAAFSPHDPHWFLDGDHTVPVPKNEEAIIVVSLDLSKMAKSSGTVISHPAAQIDSVVNILYRQNSRDKIMIDCWESIVDCDAFRRVQSEFPTSLDSITFKKIDYLSRIAERGLLTEETLSNTLSFVSINQTPYLHFVQEQAADMLTSLVGGVSSLANNPLALRNLSVLSEKLERVSEKSSEDIYENDKNLFTGRSEEIGRISSFFEDSTPLLVCQGLRGIGKSKLLRLIKPKVIPDSNIFSLYYINMSSGSGYEFLIDELFYIMGSPLNDAVKRSPDEAARLFVTCLRRRPKSCIIIDDFHYLLNRDKTYCDERTNIFLSNVIASIDGNQNKIILSTNRRIFMSHCKNVFLSRLKDDEIKWIIRYCFQAESKNIAIDEDSEIIKAIHGNPLAAVIIAQLLIDNKAVPLPKDEDTFKRFEERFITNLIGELSLSSDEETVLSLLSASDFPVEINFILKKYTHLIPSVERLIESFVIDKDSVNGTFSLHPLLIDYFRSKTSVTDSVEMHKDYAAFLEEEHASELQRGLPNPALISRLVFHYAGSLDMAKLSSFKGKYIDQLKPTAECLYREKHYKEAVEYYLAIYRSLGGNRPDITLRIAQCYVYCDDISQAEYYFSIACKQKPDTAYLYSRFAISLAFKWANSTLAETYALRAEEIYNNNSNGKKWELAEIKFALAQSISWHDKKTAFKLYKEACDIEPSNCYYLCTLCKRLYNDKHFDEAYEYFWLFWHSHGSKTA